MKTRLRRSWFLPGVWTAGAAESPFAVGAPRGTGGAVGLDAGLARLSLTLGSQAAPEVAHPVRLK
ncbi:hypothetical protein DV515_00004899, partial [Chloebia gouldiae]